MVPAAAANLQGRSGQRAPVVDHMLNMWYHSLTNWSIRSGDWCALCSPSARRIAWLPLVDAQILIDDPLKTTIVKNLRCMTTWVVRKPGGSSRSWLG